MTVEPTYGLEPTDSTFVPFGCNQLGYKLIYSNISLYILYTLFHIIGLSLVYTPITGECQIRVYNGRIHIVLLERLGSRQ